MHQNLNLTKYIFHRAAFSLLSRILIYQLAYDVIIIAIVIFLVNIDFLVISSLDDKIPIIVATLCFHLIIKFISATLIFLQWHSDIYEIRRNHIYHRRGLFNVKTEEIAMEIVEEITCLQSFFGRIFGYTHVKLGMRHSDRDPIFYWTLYYIPNHQILIEILENTLQKDLDNQPAVQVQEG